MQRIVMVALLAGAACGEETGSRAGSAGEGPGGVVESSDGRLVVDMTDAMRFEPARARVRVGDTVVWTNRGHMPHTATDDPSRAALPEHSVLPEGADPWDSGLVEPGSEHRRIFVVPGTYHYLCTLHEALNMVATIKVVP